MSRNLDERLSILRSNIKDIFTNPVELLEIRIIMSEINNTLDRISGRFDIAKKILVKCKM